MLEEETRKVAAAESSEKTPFPACGFVLLELLISPTVCSFAGVSSGEVWRFSGLAVFCFFSPSEEDVSGAVLR